MRVRFPIYWICASAASLALAQEVKSPNSAVIPVPKLENDFYDWDERHEAAKKRVASNQADLVFIGDSITHMFGGEPKSNRTRGEKVWEEFYGRRKALNLGFGWDRTQNVLWRLANGELAGQSPKAVVLLIGTNNFASTKNARENTPEEIAAGVAAICDQVHKMSPQTKILLLGIFPRGQKSDDPIRAKVAATNKLLAALDARPEVEFLDLTAKFLESDGSITKEMMPDFLHPGAKAYRLWAESIEPKIVDYLGEKKP